MLLTSFDSNKKTAPIMKQFLLLLSVILVFGFTANAQGKAKITIRKNVDGEETVIEKELDLEDGIDIEELLEEEGIDIDIDTDENSRILEIIVDEESEGTPFKFHAGCHDGKRAFLGVHSGGNSGGEGAIVGDVVEGSSADEMGIEEGDIITSFNGEDIEDFGDLRDAVLNTDPGEVVEISLKRDGKRKRIKGDVGEKSSEGNSFYWMDGNDFHYEFDEEKLQNMLE
ncbi:MAG: PDZ domain-containing protein, partial [Flavobacteriales bacterium]|nr:PDZ domain-containing protein [Flavobacteriales bacterium]